MAAAVRQRAVPQIMEDLLMFGEGLSLTEYEVLHQHAGLKATEAFADRNAIVLGVIRGATRLPFHQIADLTLESGDVVVLITDDAKPAPLERPLPTTG